MKYKPQVGRQQQGQPREKTGTLVDSMVQAVRNCGNKNRVEGKLIDYDLLSE